MSDSEIEWCILWAIEDWKARQVDRSDITWKGPRIKQMEAATQPTERKSDE